MSLWAKIRGTIETVFQVGPGGPLLKANGVSLEARNAADTAYATMRVALPANEADAIRVRSLITLIDDGVVEGFSGAYKEMSPSASPFPTSWTWWTDNTKATKIVRVAITRDATTQVPTQEVWTLYTSDGTTVLKTVTDIMTYTGVFETSRTRTIT